MRRVVAIILVLLIVALVGCAEVDVTCDGGECRPLDQEDEYSIEPVIRNETAQEGPITS